ncbi:hypothetical protein GGH94_003288 [Coemansia aciculifera]|uniref:Mid2 domain-containing protein n=1 Tax=Coemansia aciculifera TaxID=417176 RepID=A0A9W8IHG2_9FUNG|nr:hypothetical protein GGH94_003288 [Coemansia aciculifera]
MSALYAIFLAVLCVLCTASAQSTFASDSTSISSSTYDSTSIFSTSSTFDSTSISSISITYLDTPMSMDNSPLASLAALSASNSQAKDIIGGVLACIAVIALMSGSIGYLIYKRYTKKRAALDAKAASSDSISEAKTLV